MLCRLQRLCPSSPVGIPLDLLQRATTLDESQVAALAACLTRELAVVQGPPGCCMYCCDSSDKVHCECAMFLLQLQLQLQYLARQSRSTHFCMLMEQ
jgi:hypothetical protein